jgi:electron transfer flavoprotein beta subunit
LTLGSDDATEALKRAVAMGIEEAILLSDSAFDGSDAWGVAHALAQAIRKIGDATLILTGKQSMDGSSGLVAPGLAVKLGVPFVSQVAKILDVTEESATVQRALDEGMQTVRVKLPAVLAVSKEINEPRYPNFMGIRKASRMQYPAAKARELPGLDLKQVGEGAALVEWTDLHKPPARTGKCEFITGASVQEQAAALVDKLIAEKVI